MFSFKWFLKYTCARKRADS